MKILVYKDNLSTGRGADKAVRNFAAGLAERGHEVELMEKAEFANWLVGERDGVRFDVVVATGPNEAMDIDAAGFFERPGRAKVVLQLHLAPRGFFKWKRFVRNRWIRKAFRKADAVQVLCRSYEAEFLEIAPQADVVTIGNYTEMDPGEARSACENPIILYPAAAFTGIKNHALLIRAFALLASEFPGWRLRLLGCNDTRRGSRCKGLAQRLGIRDRVEFAGFSSNLAAEYSNAAFIAFPSTLEGFPLALLEGAKFGLCSLAHSGLPGVTDIVCNGETGIVTEPTVEAYAGGLRRLMADRELRRTMGAKAGEFAAERYSREKILDQWEALLQRVVSAEGVGAVNESSYGRRRCRVGIYKDTLANRRGADAAVLALAEGLRERGHDAVVFEKPDFAKRVAEPWDVVVSTGTNELLDLYAWFKANASPTPTSNSNSPLFPWPVIQQFHTNPSGQFKWKHLVRNFCIRRALRHVNAIQVLQEDFVPQVKKYGAPVSVIGNWSRFSSVVKLPSPTLTSTSNSIIICPATFAKGKNQKLLIAAFARISAEFPDWKLRLLGRVDGGYADECRRLAAKFSVADRVEFAGFCDDLAAEYQRCAFVAFPSVDEGFGLVIADAASFGKPCVTVRDWIGAASADGGVVTRSTVEAYAEGLRRLMGDPGLRGRMGEAARKFVVEHYSRERILDKWETLISEVVAAAHG